ncbi:MAG: hypothetical protein ACI4WV_05395 [Eubacteriales bacterium]
MKYYGKEKCRILKEIRAQIARANDMEWVVEACTHKGNCRGTCPRCEAEVRQLERALARREAMGKTVAVVGISAGLALSVTGCTTYSETIMGDMAAPEESRTTQTESTVNSGSGEISVDSGVTLESLVEDTDTAVSSGTESATDRATEPPLPGEEPEQTEELMGEVPEESLVDNLMGEPLPEPEETAEASEDRQ